jgi:site-specific DNA-methyltransferase (adenine-specific)
MPRRPNPPDATDFEVRAGDAAEVVATLPADSIDLVVTDIPYGISLDEWDVLHANTNSALGGRSPAQEKLGAGFRRRGKPINGWSKADLDRPREYQQWCQRWGRPLLCAMKPGASAFVFAGRRLAHRAIVALEESGFLLRDLLAWEKPTAHFRAQSLSKLYERRGMAKAAQEWQGWRLGNLAPRFEPIVWLFKPYTIGGTIADNVLEHGVGAMHADGCQQAGRAPGNLLTFDYAAGERGLHAAQKPVALLEYLIRLTTREGQLVVDPFCGSGSTGVAALNLSRRFLGIDEDKGQVRAAQKRLRESCAARTGE